MLDGEWLMGDGRPGMRLTGRFALPMTQSTATERRGYNGSTKERLSAATGGLARKK
jgi:hypothetical protein